MSTVLRNPVTGRPQLPLRYRVDRVRTRVSEWWRWVWREVVTPPHLRAVFFLSYVVMLWTGWRTLVNPPKSIEGEIGSTLATVWGLCFVVCAVTGLCTVFTTWWWAERTGLGFGLLGIAVYLLVIGVLTFAPDSQGSRDTQFGQVAYSLFVPVLRWLTIREWSYQPQPKED